MIEKYKDTDHLIHFVCRWTKYDCFYMENLYIKNVWIEEKSFLQVGIKDQPETYKCFDVNNINYINEANDYLVKIHDKYCKMKAFS